MSHAHRADKLLIKPAAGARPAPPRRSDGSFPRHARRPVTRRVTSGTETPGWRRPQTDRPAESHSPLRPRSARLDILPFVLSESPLESTEHGLVLTGKGWFVLNAREAPWYQRTGRLIRRTSS
jgi:hypothetical protein